MASSERPLIFDIHRLSMDDGPGLRTVIFFKGCPLACFWCHNPEGIHPQRELLVNASRCIPCGVEYSVEEVLEKVLEDRAFLRASGGGVTLSGGEPTTAMAFAGELARRLKAEGIPVAIQTCGFFPWEEFKTQLLPHLELVFFDIKLMDPIAHRHHTGADNRLIHENLRRVLACASVKVTVCTPLIPGITDTPENLEAIRIFLASCGQPEHRLLPHNPILKPFSRNENSLDIKKECWR